jgi:hypothetical protein
LSQWLELGEEDLNSRSKQCMSHDEVVPTSSSLLLTLAVARITAESLSLHQPSPPPYVWSMFCYELVSRPCRCSRGRWPRVIYL